MRFTDWGQSPLVCCPVFRIHCCLTTLCANHSITDSFCRKGADNGLPMPQHYTGTFKKYAPRPHRSVCNVLFFALPYSIATYAKHIIYRLLTANKVGVVR